LFPLLEERWPGVIKRLSRTARNARITATAMAVFIESQSGDLIRDRIKMPLQKLLGLEPEMQTLIVRQWLRRHEVPVLPEARLREFLEQLAGAEPGNQAEVQWEGWMMKRYQLDIWLHRHKPFMLCPDVAWTSGMKVDLGPDLGRLLLKGKSAEIPSAWQVRSRESRDKIRVRPEGPRLKLKQLFQSALIPPWLRPGIPVLVWDDEPVAVGDWVIAHRLQTWLYQNDLKLKWQPADPILARLRMDCQR
ncbi:MAG: tRNA lysidine(34) synthetase TilS, partial [Xanthomonadales bacterium]|nr:tRNA lysidine(34) synthetase TilS [Xanthomonadales bacterium]